MAHDALTTGSMLVCPHQGQVEVVPSQTRVRVDGQPVLTASDVFTITGCPFHIGVVASPCVTIQWVKPDARCRAGGAPTLSKGSVGICISANGATQGRVVIQQNQTTATTE